MKKPNYRNVEGKSCEIIAVDWLLSQGCYTYTPTMEQGPVDIVAFLPKVSGSSLMLKRQVVEKTVASSAALLKEKQKRLGVRLLYVDVETKECHLYPHQFNPYAVSATQRRQPAIQRC